jgi:hypothetical protein
LGESKESILNPSIIETVEQIGGNLSDPIWQWFLRNGPHGSSFCWSPTKQGAPGYSGLEHLRRIVSEKAAIEPRFPVKAREVAIAAIGTEYADLIRRGIQVLAAVGLRSDVEKIKPLTEHSVDAVAKDARACLFELKRA